MTTLINEFTISKEAKDGKLFMFDAVKCVEDSKWYILQDDCGVARNKKDTVKTMKDMLTELIADYEF